MTLLYYPQLCRFISSSYRHDAVLNMMKLKLKSIDQSLAIQCSDYLPLMSIIKTEIITITKWKWNHLGTWLSAKCLLLALSLAPNELNPAGFQQFFKTLVHLLRFLQSLNSVKLMRCPAEKDMADVGTSKQVSFCPLVSTDF